MKKIVLLLVALLLAGQGRLLAANPDSTGTAARKASQKTVKKVAPRKTPAKLKGFIDRNGNGIDDRLESAAGKKGQKKRRGKSFRTDRFIDLDGDGICDGRESGLGLRKLYQHRHGKGPGKR